MKKQSRFHTVIPTLLVLGLAILLPVQVAAQSPIDPNGPGGDPGSNPSGPQYNVTIIGDFESKCLLDGTGHLYHDELSNTIVACQNQEVTYTAYASTDGDAVINWAWTVYGAASVSYTGNEATVIWGTEATGQLVVTVTTASGHTYTHRQTVRLIESPIAAASSVPGYNADHVIYVCQGMDVEFADQSHTQSSDIAGYYWEGCGSTSSSHSFLLQSVTMPCTVTHRVYNNCGCYDEEFFYIEVLEGAPLELSCYGTACEGSTVTYHTGAPPVCDEYFWTVEGGHLVNGQGTPDITVVWDSPTDGYGIISLDGTLCGGNVCQGSLSVRIPIIQNGVPIDGQTEACVGDAVLYSVPLYGSTRYAWSITPTAGVDSTPVNGANKMTYKFTSPGTYQISVRYKCDFLACGEFATESITVVVRPGIRILGDNEVCLTNTATLTTDAPTTNNLMTWKVYEPGSDQPVYTSPAPTAQFATSVIQSAGRFRVTAENGGYCSEASFILTVKDPPPAPTVEEMDPDNPAVACPHSTILLKATPSNPLYNIIWKPVCASAAPSRVSGEEVSITYGPEVCGVDAYYYDRELQCVSADHYTHMVVPFALAQHHLPQALTVCPGTRLVWGNSVVPYQDGVLYEWLLSDEEQHCATIEGDIHANAVTLLVNDIDHIIDQDIPFDVYLIRKYCGQEDTATVHVTIAALPQPLNLSIDPQAPICQGTNVDLTGRGCTACGGGVGRYRWHFSDDNQTGTGPNANHTFNRPGDIFVTLTCNPYDVCTNGDYLPTANRIVQVIPNPPAHYISYDGTYVAVEPQSLLNPSDYDFQWGHLPDNSNVVSATPGGSEYTCTVISRTNPSCTTIVKNEVKPCQPLTVGTPSVDYCNKTVSFSVDNPPTPIVWTILGREDNDWTVSGDYNENIEIPVSTVGTLIVRAETEEDPCYSATMAYTVDFMPDFSLQKACSTIVVHNRSLSLDGSKVVKIMVTRSGGTADYLTFPVSQGSITYPIPCDGTYTFSLVMYDGITINCPLGSVYIENTSNLTVDVTSANPVGLEHWTCDNTAIQLTASLPSPHTILHSHWNFGDQGTSLDTNGNSVYHTYRYNSNLPPPPTNYIILLTITDENGCKHNGNLNISSFANDLKEPSVWVPANAPVCPGNEILLECRINNSPLYNPSCTTTYNWSVTPSTNSYTQPVSHTGDYSVIVSNEHYCKTEAAVNVQFKNQPSAIIIPKKYYYCVGETVDLDGRPDDMSNNYRYLWTVLNNTTNQTTTTTNTTGTLSFPAGSTACTYTVDLTVTDINEGCSATATPVTITVVNPPSPPSVHMDPQHECLDQGFVRLIGNNPSQMLNWSNGDYGNTADYHYPGVALAYYYDPVSGCRSDSAVIHIPAAPDFDALLTGCYDVCYDIANASLPVYGLLPRLQSYGWEWYHNNSLYASSPLGPQPSPLNLPLVGLGKYDLSVNYFSNCHASARSLVIQDADLCPCDSIDISYTCKNTSVQNCHLIYDIAVTVCNNSRRTHCFNSLLPLFNPLAGNITITGNTFTPTTPTPGNCFQFTITLDVTALDPSTVAFRLLDENCAECSIDFSVDLMPTANCNNQTAGSISTNGTISDDNTVYCNFYLDVPGVTNVLAVWSEPQAVVNYTYASPAVNGLCAFRQSDLENNSKACIYALVCTNNTLCIWYYCTSTEELLDNPKAAGHGSNGGNVTSQEPSLKPNPTTGEVSVIGIPDEVVEILVMDMTGRSMDTFAGTARFNIAGLPSGAYIVRVKTRHNTEKPADTNEASPRAPQELVTYLKLVKK